MGWFRGTLLPTNLTLLPLFSVLTLKDISENKTLAAGIILGLAIILAIRYTTNPWRKLPPSPSRLPILGNALQLRDKGWLLSKDCKDRFREFTDYVNGVRLGGLTGHQEMSCISTVLDSPSLSVTVSSQLSSCSTAVRPTIRIDLD